ncbi:hypothetical protein HRbin01_01619 [archaeon HR01]|nr:hypothetical protein HRbin01_01619 [archaeon HR01]
MAFFPTKTRYRLVEKGVGEVPEEVVRRYGLYRRSRLAGLGLPGVLHDEKGRYICKTRIDIFRDPPQPVWEVYEVFKVGSEG